jgi:predicted metal-dependent hydrolase
VQEIDLRPLVENHLWTLAEVELRARTKELAAHHAIPIERVTVRAQASRWGSSSRAGTISLNWRLIQTPDEVRDYVILHELMHQREMNHSPRFWALVEAACPAHESRRRWLKDHGARIL